jgi:hypothetical protein
MNERYEKYEKYLLSLNALYDILFFQTSAYVSGGSNDKKQVKVLIDCSLFAGWKTFLHFFPYKKLWEKIEYDKQRQIYWNKEIYIYIHVWVRVCKEKRAEGERGCRERERERERVKIRKKQKKIKPIILGLPTSLAVFKNKSGTERKPNFLDATCAVYYNALPPYYAILSNIYINIYIYIYIYIFIIQTECVIIRNYYAEISYIRILNIEKYQLLAVVMWVLKHRILYDYDRVFACCIAQLTVGICIALDFWMLYVFLWTAK